MYIISTLREMFLTVQPFVVVFNGLIAVTITLYLFYRSRPVKPVRIKFTSDALIINWTGHPLPKEEWLETFKIWIPKNPPVFNVSSWKSIQHSVRKMINDMPRDIQLRFYKGDPNIVIAIPQLAVGVSVLLATWHGKTGVFPTITSPLRKEDGTFWLPEPIRLSDIRLDSRKERNFD